MALHLSLVGFDHQREAFGNTDGRCNFERRPGLGKIAYGAVNGAAPEGNLARPSRAGDVVLVCARSTAGASAINICNFVACSIALFGKQMRLTLSFLVIHFVPPGKLNWTLLSARVCQQAVNNKRLFN